MFDTIDEPTEFTTRRHWIVLAPSLLLLLPAMAIAVFLGGFAWALWGLVGSWAVWKALNWWSDEISITSQRLSRQSGLLTRDYAFAGLIHVTDLSFQQTVTGRMLHFGKVTVETPGQEQPITVIDHVPNPKTFCNRINEYATIAKRQAWA